MLFYFENRSTGTGFDTIAGRRNEPWQDSCNRSHECQGILEILILPYKTYTLGIHLPNLEKGVRTRQGRTTDPRPPILMGNKHT